MKTALQQVWDTREIKLRETRAHFLAYTVSDMAVLRELTGYGSMRHADYDKVLAEVSAQGFSFAVMEQ